MPWVGRIERQAVGAAARRDPPELPSRDDAVVLVAQVPRVPVCVCAAQREGLGVVYHIGSLRAPSCAAHLTQAARTSQATEALALARATAETLSHLRSPRAVAP
jgi:hypothetical protein